MRFSLLTAFTSYENLLTKGLMTDPLSSLAGQFDKWKSFWEILQLNVLSYNFSQNIPSLLHSVTQKIFLDGNIDEKIC